MKDENELVTPDEYVIRMVWMDHYKEGLALPIQPGAFAPKKNETDGISVFRADCVNSPEDVLHVIAQEKREKYAIAMLKVAELQGIGLTVKPAKIDTIRGHSVLPELNVVSVQENPDLWRDVRKKLAALAGQSIIKCPARTT
jgi:hypothetical protein